MENGQFERLLAEIAESRRHTDEAAAGLRQHTDEAVAGLRQHTDESVAESRRHSEVVAEGLRQEIRLVAEGVEVLDGKIARQIGELRREMNEGFDEIKAMIRLSYAELDRRLRTLEEIVLALQSRVDRLEKAERVQ
jgi:hypothetical protein